MLFLQKNSLPPPSEMTEWKLGDRISRDNFTSFLIQSYAISRGFPHLQKIFFMWLEKRFGFDYESTINDFVDGGGWKILADSEKEKFKEAFRKVAKHAPVTTPPNTADFQIAQEIKTLIRNEIPEAKELRIRFFDLENIETLTQFNQAAVEYIQSRRKSIKKN